MAAGLAGALLVPALVAAGGEMPLRPAGSRLERPAGEAGPVRARLRRVARVNVKEAREIALQGDWAVICQNLSGMTMLNVRNPSRPRVANIYGPELVQAMHAAFAGKDLLVIADRFRGLRLWRIVLPSHVEELSTLLLPGVPNHVALFSRQAEQFAAVACGGSGLAVVDITDPRQPRLVSTFHLDSDFARRVLVDDEGLGLLADQYDGGLKFLDLSDPSAPALLLKVHLSGYCESLALSGDLLFAGYRQYGTRVFRIARGSGGGEGVTTPTVELLCSLYRGKNRVRNVAAVGSSLLVVADDAGGVDLYDTSDPRRPVLASEFRFDRAEDGVASSVAVDGRHIYVPSWDGGVNVFDVVLDDNFRP